MDGASVEMTCCSTSITLVPENGVCPENISNAITASAYRSLRPSTGCSDNCSGEA